jgi:hypothetical protein
MSRARWIVLGGLALIPLCALALDRPRHRAPASCWTPGAICDVTGRSSISAAGAQTLTVTPVTSTAPPGPIAPDAFTLDQPKAGATVTGPFPVSGTAGGNWKNIACYSGGSKVSGDMAPTADGAWSGTANSLHMSNGPSVPLLCTAFSTLPGIPGGVNTSQTVNLNVDNQGPPVPPGDNFTLGGYTFGAPALEDDFASLATIAGNVPAASAQYKWYASGNGYGATVSCCTGTAGPDSPDNPYSLTPGGGLTITAKSNGGSWVTGMFSSVAGNGTGFKALGGYWEASVKFPTEPRGTWPGWWMLSSPNGNGNPPQTAEADIFETFGTCGPQNNGAYNRAIASTYHLWNMPPNGQHEDGGHKDIMLDFDMSQDYHLYGLLWNGTSVDIYVDRQLKWSNPTPSVMHQAMYAIFNLGMNACTDIGYAQNPTKIYLRYIKIWTFPDLNGKGF